MEYIVPTSNKGKIKMSFTDDSMQNIRIGDLVLSINDFMELMHTSIRNKSSEISLNGYKIPGIELGYKLDNLIFEGSYRDTVKQKYL